MLGALLLQLAMASSSADSAPQTALYVRGEAPTRYPGQVERIEVAIGRSGEETRVLVLFLIVFRTYRIVRWWRRRARVAEGVE